jgi:hypothetical protein
MKENLCFGFLLIFMVVSLVGFTAAGESPSYIIHITGNESSITNGSDEMMEITIMDIDPNVSTTNGNQSYTIPVEALANLTTPADAAVVFSDAGNETVSLVKISQVSLSPDRKNLTIQVSLLQFYDGEGLKSFAENQTEIPSGIDNNLTPADLYIETSVILAENSVPTCPSGSFFCGMYSTCMSNADSSKCGITKNIQ